MANRNTTYKPFPIYDYVIESLDKLNRGDDLRRVQKDTGIKRWTMMKYVIKDIPNPGVKNIELLYHYFKAREGKDLRQRHQ